MLEDFDNDDKSLIPQIGSVITVTGVCSSTLHIQENVATLFIRDDPRGAVSFCNKIKIDIARCENNKHEVDNLSKEINTNMHVGVKGRVEKLDKEDDVVDKDRCKMIKFKLVIDSDDHALFSQCWWPLQVGSENPNVGDFVVDDESKKVYCDADVSDEQILQYVVAFKNSFDGEIFVGVEKNGEITGMEGSNGKWCKRMSKAIGSLVPEAIEGADICRNVQEASELAHGKRCFVCVLPLYNDSSRTIGWIHVPKGEEKLYFRKVSDVHAYKRIGAETKRITNYKQLFYDLDSLASMQIEPLFEKYDEEDDEQDEEKCKSPQAYTVLEDVKHESQHELKMIFSDDPAEKIRKYYLGQYACGFLNSDGGKIFFGVQEDEQ